MKRLSMLALVLAVAGCASSGAWQEEDAGFTTSTSRPPRVLIEVETLNFADARLYAISDGQRLSLGTVGGKQNDSFTIPWRYSQALQIEINLLAGPTCVTESLQVDRGDILELQIASVFNNSSFCR